MKYPLSLQKQMFMHFYFELQAILCDFSLAVRQNIKLLLMLHDLRSWYISQGLPSLMFFPKVWDLFVFLKSRFKPTLNQIICYSSCWVRAGLDCLSPVKCFLSCSQYYTHLSGQWTRGRTNPLCQDKPPDSTYRNHMVTRVLLVWLKECWIFLPGAKTALHSHKFDNLRSDTVYWGAPPLSPCFWRRKCICNIMG